MLSSTQFHYDSKTRRFVADISDFGPGFQFDQAYPDAVDYGFSMVSQKTGALSGWVHTSNLNTPDGEFRGWIFTPMPRTLRALPHLQGVEVHIYND